MKVILSILYCFLCSLFFGQFAVIDDPDGFVNVRKSPKVCDNILDKLTNGHVVFCFEEEGEWIAIEYDLNRHRKSAFIHKSRINLIASFQKVLHSVITDSTVYFKHDSLSLKIKKNKFVSKMNKLQYHKGNRLNNEADWLEKINNKQVWGTDGNMPKFQYEYVTLIVGTLEIYLNRDNLFEPNLKHTSLNIDSKNKIIYVTSTNSDGAGAYTVLWIIENSMEKKRITIIPF